VHIPPHIPREETLTTVLTLRIPREEALITVLTLRIPSGRLRGEVYTLFIPLREAKKEGLYPGLYPSGRL